MPLYRISARVVALALFAVTTQMATPAAAQTIGTFRWQLLPYCNVVSITVIQAGSLFQLIGTDDACGGGQMPLHGSAVAGGSDVRMGFSIAIPGGRTSHVTSTVSLGTLAGTWDDEIASSGTFAFLAGAPTAGLFVRPIPGIGRVKASYRGDGSTATNLGAGTINLGAATITVPVGGTLVANAHVSMLGLDNVAMVDCALSLSTTIDDTFTQRGTAADGHVVSISTARHFAVLEGTHTVRLLCRRFTAIPYSLIHPQISVVFVP